MRRWGGLLVLVIAACSGTSSTGQTTLGDTCFDGTKEACRAEVSADAGDASSLSCGPGTHLSGEQCIVDGVQGGLVCGSGTHQLSGVCLPDPTTNPKPVEAGVTTCGPGTHQQEMSCLPDRPDAGVTCGPGTIESGGECLPAFIDGSLAYYDVRVPVQRIDADGFSKVPVTVLGRLADGSPSLEPILLSTSRLGAGTLTPLGLTLAPGGSSSFFVPCNAANSPACVGDVRITMSRASDPNTVIASSTLLTLVAPTGVGSPAACLGGGDVLFFDGEAGDYIHQGVATITQGKWTANVSDFQVHIHVDPTSQSQGLWWDTYFDSSKIGQPLTAQVYSQAERWPFQSANKAGLDVSGDGRGCNMLTGRFQIETLEKTGTDLTSFTATFEQHCDGGPALHGCVHFEP